MSSGSAFGYATSHVVDRDTRHMLQNRDRREAMMISGKAPVSTNPLAVQKSSAGYADETTRLRAGAEKQLRAEHAAERQHRERVMVHLHDSRKAREDARLRAADDELAKAKRDGALLAGSSLRNNGSVPYNLINGTFTSEDARRKSEYEAQFTKHSFMMRTQKLDRTLNPAGYNIINGTDRRKVEIPPMPDPL